MVSRFEQFSSPRILLLAAMGFLTGQGAVLLGGSASNCRRCRCRRSSMVPTRHRRPRLPRRIWCDRFPNFGARVAIGLRQSITGNVVTMTVSLPTNWVGIGLSLVGVGLLGLLVPGHYEGPVLVPISPGHGLSIVDILALVPLVLGTGIVYWGLCNRRERLLAIATAAPTRWSIGVFVCGFGLGLLLASAFSTFWWWWAIGADIVAASLLVAIRIATGYPRESR